MVIKENIVIIIILILTGCFFINSGCHKPCVPNHYNFQIDSTSIKPAKDSITIGDTLFFESITSTSMTNKSDRKLINYSGADNLGSVLGIGELVGLNQIGDAVNYFSYIPIQGKIYTDNQLSPNRVKQIIFIEENGSYNLRFAIIPQKKGIYVLTIADMPDVVRKCDRSVISMNFNLSLNNHLRYLKDIYYGGGQINPLDSTHAYCFKVY